MGSFRSERRAAEPVEGELEAPGTDNKPNWGSLYRARGEEVSATRRPVFTGDIYADVDVGAGQRLRLIVLQHPCTIDHKGKLAKRLLVAEVRPLKGGVIRPSKWADHYYKLLPLHELDDEEPHHWGADFDEHYIVTREALLAGIRTTILSQVGVNLLMQRWVNHNSRVVPHTKDFNAMFLPQYEETDLMEEWIDEREDAVGIEAATAEVDAWFSARLTDQPNRRQQLKDTQRVPNIRSDMRAHLRSLRGR